MKKIALEKMGLPGAVVQWSERGKVDSQACGFSVLYDVDLKPIEKPVPMQVDHVFDLASLTKVLSTLSLVYVLLEKNQLSLDQSLAAFFPDIAQDKGAISLRHLLTHTSGLCPWLPLYGLANSSEDAISLVLKKPLQGAVGERKIYSDLNYILLGCILEKITKKDLDSLFCQWVSDPLSLKQTGYLPLNKGFGPLVATSQGNPFEQKMVYDESFGYSCDPAAKNFKAWRDYTLMGEVNDGNAFHIFSGVAGHAGLFGPAKEILKIVQWQINHPLFDPALGWFTLADWGQRYGADFGLLKWPEDTLCHSGFTGTFVMLSRSQNRVLVFLSNRQNKGVESDGKYPNIWPQLPALVASYF